ncbi:MAG: hypothetical protein ACUVWX_03375 [Kiritimatiellia bacterium]
MRETAGLIGGLLFLSSILWLPTVAGDWTWCGGGTNDRWTTLANWSPSGQPASRHTTRLTFTGTQRLSPDQDIVETFLFNSILFDVNAGAFELGGTTNYAGLAGFRNYKFAGSNPTISVLGTNSVLIKGTILCREEASDHYLAVAENGLLQIPWVKGGKGRRVVKEGRGILRIFEHADGQRYATGTTTVGPEWFVRDGTLEVGTRSDRYVLGSDSSWVRASSCPKVAYNLVVGDGSGAFGSAVFRLIGSPSSIIHANTSIRIESDGVLDLGGVQDLDLQSSGSLTNRSGNLRLGNRSLRLRSGNSLFLGGSARVEGTATDSLWLADGCEIIVDATDTRAVLATDARLDVAEGKSIVFRVADKPNDAVDLDVLGHLGAGGLGGRITKLGPGTMAVLQHTCGSGTTNVVAEGCLRLAGVSTGGKGACWIVSTNGALTGSGAIIGADVLVDGGTLQPGDDVGTLTVEGNVTVRSSGRLVIEVSRHGASVPAEYGRLAIGGRLSGLENLDLVVLITARPEIDLLTLRVVTCTNDLTGSSFRSAILMGAQGRLRVTTGQGFVDVLLNLRKGTGLILR